MARLRAIELSDRTVDLRTGQVRHGATLTDRERRVLAHLAANPRRDVDREELLSQVWGYSPRSVSRTVDTTIRRLRKKIEVDPERPRHLLTVWGVGYRFEPSVGPSPNPPVGAVDCAAHIPSAWWTLGSRRIDIGSGRIVTGDRTVWLTFRERAVLEALASGTIVDAPTLARAVWGRHTGNEQALHSLIHRIRRKIEPDPSAPRYLLTTRSRGFRLVTDPARAEPTVCTIVQLRPTIDAAVWDRDPFGSAEALESPTGDPESPTGDPEGTRTEGG